tara:strand:- start:551 stop:2245 length:1695 start_codon:yes stop_codon:yes gene_type:complete
MASFGEGFASGMQMGDMFRKRQYEQSIDDAGLMVAEEMKLEKADRELQKRRLADNAISTDIKPINPSIYQQGDSLGMQGYQTGNKPIQTTVPIAPPGYMSPPGEEVTPGIDTNGYYEPEPNTSANPATAQTLVGNYNTTAALKGERPTREDSLRMQQDNPVPFGESLPPNVVDLAQIKSEVAPQVDAKPKALDTLNDQITTSMKAKDIYDYNTRVIQKLQQSGNARAALEYQGKMATSELTLAQADSAKFTTIQAVAKQVGSLADNVLEDMQQPGADINQLYFNFGERIRNEFGYTGKIPFSLDPRENLKTLGRLQKDATTTAEKAEIEVKTNVASFERSIKNSKERRDEDELTLKKLAEARAQGKEVRDEAQAVFNRYAKEVEITQKAMDSLNPYQDKETKKRYAEDQKVLIAKMKEYTNVFGVTASNMGNVKPGATGAAVNTPATTQPNNTRFGESTTAVMEEKPVTDTAGGFVPPTPKTPAQGKAKELKIKQLKATIESRQKSLNPGMETESDIERRDQLRIKAKQNRDAVKEAFTGKKKRQALEEDLLKAQKELAELTKP